MSERRVLVVDDDDAVRSLLRHTLEGTYEVSEAEDGQQALAQLGRELPDLVLLDWRMPGIGGASVLDVIKSAYPNLPVVVLTSESQDHHRALAESLGVDVFLTKPFSPIELLATLERLLGS
jgi:two-component system, OmpR family, phosphate regulon response regulator PhoB